MQTQNITLDFCRNDYKDVTVKQYDKDSRNVLIKCTDNGYIYKLNPDIHKCNLKMNTPDNRAIYNPATITEDGRVLVVFNENMVHASGTGKLEIQVIEKATQRTLSSMILTVIIVGSVYSDDTIISSDEFQVLTDALKEIEDAVESAKNVNDIVDKISDLEDEVRVSETARQNAETIRQTNESVRESNEAARIANEASRQVNTTTAITNADAATKRANDAASNAENAANEAQDILGEVNDFKEIINTVEGSTILIDDSANAKLQSLKLYGKSEQFSTTGAQLANLPDKEEFTNPADGITWSCKNGAITAKGTALVQSPSSWGGIRYELPIVAGSYYISGGSNIRVQCLVTKSDDTLAYYAKQSFDLDGTEKKCVVYAVVYSDVTVDETVYPMLNKGTEALPWEPYTNCKPSPNPDYPQDIVSAGDNGSVEVGVYGKNLLEHNATNKTIDGVTFTVNEDGSITANGTASGNANSVFTVTASYNGGLLRLQAGKYVLSGSPTGCSKSSYYLQLYNYNGKDGFAHEYSNGGVFDFTNAGGIYNVALVIVKGTTVSNLTFKPMLRLASIEDDTYEPYTKQTLTALTPNGLPGIKVTDASLATYTDADGQMWCSDEIDFESGVYIQRILVETVKMNLAATKTNTKQYDGKMSATMLGGMTGGLCSHSAYYRYDSQDNEHFYIAKSNNVHIYAGLDEELTEATFAGILATPIETPLSESELEAYKALRSNNPTTTIMNRDNVHMEVDYVKEELGGDVARIAEDYVNDVKNQLGKIKYKEIWVDSNEVSSHFEAIKLYWEDFELDSIYLVRVARGSHRIALVQKYSKNHNHGAVMIFGYSGVRIEFYMLSDGTWIEGYSSATLKDLANYFTLESGNALKAQLGNLASLQTTNKADLVAAINEVRNAISAGGTEAAVTMSSSDKNGGKSYTIKQGSNAIGTIDVPKDITGDIIGSMGEIAANTDANKIPGALPFKDLYQQVKNIRYQYIEEPYDSGLTHMQIVKNHWSEMEYGMYLATIVCGSERLAIIQKYHGDLWGSVFLFGYSVLPEYSYLENGVWIDRGEIAFDAQLANYLPLSTFKKTNNNLYRSDLNTITYKTSGYCNECTNTPPNAGNGYLEVIPVSNTIEDYLVQRYTSYDASTHWVRQKLATGTWTNWVNPFSNYLPLWGGYMQGNIHPSEIDKYYLGLPNLPWVALYANNLMLVKNNANYGHMQVTGGTKDGRGYGVLTLGNATPEGSDGNGEGVLRLYGSNSGFTNVHPGNSGTANHTITLPDKTGTLLCSADKPTGTYTGNGSAEFRTINTGADGNCAVIYDSVNNTMALATPAGAFFTQNNSADVIYTTSIVFIDGRIGICHATQCNVNGTQYKYQVL